MCDDGKTLAKLEKKHDIPSLPKKTWHVPSMKSPASVAVLGVVISPVERIDRAHHRARIEAHLHQLLPRLLKALGPGEKKMQFLWENHGEMVISLGANADLTGDNGDLTRKKCGSAREKSDSTRKKM